MKKFLKTKKRTTNIYQQNFKYFKCGNCKITFIRQPFCNLNSKMMIYHTTFNNDKLKNIIITYEKLNQSDILYIVYYFSKCQFLQKAYKNEICKNELMKEIHSEFIKCFRKMTFK